MMPTAVLSRHGETWRRLRRSDVVPTPADSCLAVVGEPDRGRVHLYEHSRHRLTAEVSVDPRGNLVDLEVALIEVGLAPREDVFVGSGDCPFRERDCPAAKRLSIVAHVIDRLVAHLRRYCCLASRSNLSDRRIEERLAVRFDCSVFHDEGGELVRVALIDQPLPLGVSEPPRRRADRLQCACLISGHSEIPISVVGEPGRVCRSSGPVSGGPRAPRPPSERAEQSLVQRRSLGAGERSAECRLGGAATPMIFPADRARSTAAVRSPSPVTSARRSGPSRSNASSIIDRATWTSGRFSRHTAAVEPQSSRSNLG